MLDEKEFRKPTWVEGEWITLADGGRWSFPRPVIQFSPVFGADGSVEWGDRALSFGPDYDAKVEAFASADNGIDQTNAALKLAVDLLGRNYTLGPGEYRTLLRWAREDPENQEMWDQVVRVACGIPKETTASG